MKQNQTKLIHLGLVALLALSACLNSVSENNLPQEILSSLSLEVIIPRFERFTQTSEVLAQSANALCQNPSDVALDNTHAAWRDTRTSWRALEPFYFGPHKAFPDRIGKVIDFWPVREGSIDDLLTSDDAVTPQAYRLKGALVRGVAAVEYLLYGPPAEQLPTANASDRLCAVLVAMTLDLNELANGLNALWIGGEAPYIETFTQPQAGEFMNERGALSELVNRMGFTLENMRVDRLGTPLGDKVGGQLQPQVVESRYSGHSLNDLKAPLETIEHLFFGSGTEDSLALVHQPRLAQRTDIIETFRTRLAAARQAINEIEEPLADNLEQRAPVRNAFERLKDLQTLIQGDIINVLGLSLAFNDTDGD